ncbi:hypothetical protein H4R20_002500 [Coemansia guatemalensis]|uniref:Uncharacterized protein n=1 Tax=Coemansia guatemalensis TaxID=2761395 RepID=A0A9W8HV18_9FUNG|nr:hypothetical protein H4R20_002500 [Coemansia guatemalensis]
MGIGRFASITATCVLLLAQQTLGNLTGQGTITYHDFQSLPMNLLANNPPSCGMPYAQLDVTRITAVQQMDKATDCGQCIKVCNADDTSKYVYVLAVDTGGRGLDLSKPSFAKLFNIDDGVGPAQWEPVSSSNCAGIWSNGPGDSGDDYQNANTDSTPATTADSKPATTEQPVVSSPPVAQPTPSKEPVAAAPPPPSDQSTAPPSVPRTSSAQQQPVANSETDQQDTGSANDETGEATTPEEYSSKDSDSLGLGGVAHDAGNSSDSLLDEETESLSEDSDSETSNGLAAFSTLSTLLLGALVALSTAAQSV